MPLHQAPESLFWSFITERHAIYLRRTAGEPKPWTQDPILRDYKFTNIFRELDRGTVWLRENFLEPHRDDDLGLVAFNACWYRMFNWYKTAEALGWQDDWNTERNINLLEARAAAGHQIFTGAHMLKSETGKSKIQSICEVCAELYHICVAAGALVECCQEEKSLQVVFEILRTVPFVGPFLAYEMVTDMRHTRLLEDAHDINSWANVGPGAARGLSRLGMAPTLASMRDLLARSQENLPSDFPLLELRDIEHTLCEHDKYCRVFYWEGRPRSKYPGAA